MPLEGEGTTVQALSALNEELPTVTGKEVAPVA